ncbi:hypothetical protein BsIDN1_65580 [Bacillus safensis]|uniref:Uncharacterized protein n=1 Tax=Bacillus safensis TaxID=561879 RepID=A0A5S9MHK3_BACIA|nr:hypothetical protein BsIDN1_65580 [Bacillus safensis]
MRLFRPFTRFLCWTGEYVSDEVLIDDPRYHTPHSVTGEDVIQVVPTGPDMKESMSDLYDALISNAKQFVWIATPYFVPNESIDSHCAQNRCHKRGGCAGDGSRDQ